MLIVTSIVATGAGLRVAAEDYEAGLTRAALIESQSTVWATAAADKATALANILSLRTQLLTEMQAYNVASGIQQSCLMRVPVSSQFRADYGQQPARLSALVAAALSESSERRAWGASGLSGFDVEGRNTALPLDR